jgi:hypothetical protein
MGSNTTQLIKCKECLWMRQYVRYEAKMVKMKLKAQHQLPEIYVGCNPKC